MTRFFFPVLTILSLLLAGCAPASNSPQPVSPLSEQGGPFTQASTPTSDSASTSVPAPKTLASPEKISSSSISYPVVDTSQGKCYDATSEIQCADGDFAGQDAQYEGNTPRYQDNGDGTVIDLVTGLMWQQAPGAKKTYSQAAAGAAFFKLGGYADWRLPTIKELYLLILFDGTDVSACLTGQTCDATPFIDTRYFKFSYGDTGAGERVIDSQFATSTKYVSTTMQGAETMFGVNFADGRIKGYPVNKTFFVLYVRGNPDYGKNSFADNHNGTITDSASGLTWMQADSGMGMDWQSALNYCESLNLGGSSAWRLPNAKELQSIVDYSCSPATTNSAANDPLFGVTAITDEAGQTDYPFYWSSTTHADSSGHGAFAAYLSFGRALGYMNNAWLDVHGAGAQRSDPKTGSESQYPQGHGPQGDAVRVQNHVRCVSGSASFAVAGVASQSRPTMQVQSTGIQQNPQQPGGGAGQSGQIPHGQGQGSQPVGAPPLEAVNACAGVSQGAACTFNAPARTVTGSCQLVQQQLACVPSSRP